MCLLGLWGVWAFMCTCERSDGLRLTLCLKSLAGGYAGVVNPGTASSTPYKRKQLPRAEAGAAAYPQQ